tara:strand:- start:166 stop:399 length:234 start_codon:yes stop_codon:yes gene_type:complete
MQSFTIEQLGLFITLMGGTASAIIVACFKSRCSKIKTPCISCDRDTSPAVNKKTTTPLVETDESTIQPPTVETNDLP